MNTNHTPPKITPAMLNSGRKAHTFQVLCMKTRGPRPYVAGQAERLILISEIEAVSAALNEVFPSLPPKVKVQCLELSHHLAALRLHAR
jgi:hypothetical protein